MAYDNTNSGVLFKNDRKTHPNQPDYRGSLNVNGDEFWVSSWIKEGKKGKFLTLALQPKESQVPDYDETPAPPVDDIPF